MRPFHRRDPHARFRELLSARLDVPLALDESWHLTVHLARCEICRAVERDYREQRRALHTLPHLLPPRDLWARTSAALDREIVRRGPSGAGEHDYGAGTTGWLMRRSSRQRPFSTASLATSLVAVGAVAVLVFTQLPLTRLPDPTNLHPTPLTVPGLPLAFLGSGPMGLSIYSTSIDSVCPLSALDCVGQPESRTVHALSRSIEPSSLALSPSGRELAISGRDGGFAIVMMPAGAEPPGPTPRTTQTPIDEPPPSADTERTPLVDSPLPTVPGEPEQDALTVLAILDAVGVGAPPAWSSDGSVLAFSAMPADGTRGPDLYVWRPGDQTAQQMTSDASTYFASWSGSRIVVSRVAAVDPAAESPVDATPAAEHPDHVIGVDPTPVATARRQAVAVSTVLIDPESGDEDVLADTALWLPQVNRQGTHAVAWHGSLAWRGAHVLPDAGALYLVDWRTLDPLAARAHELEPTDELGPVEPMPSQPPASPSPAQVPATTEPSPTASVLLLTLPPIEPDGDTDADADEPDEATPAPTPTPPLIDLRPLEPARDPETRPVRDWEVRWSPNGVLVGFWTADAAGTSWGRLAVLSVDLQSGDLGHATPVLPPTLARRSFTLGSDRLAWVGPSDGNPEGELRLTAWGPNGSGVMRFSNPDSGGAVTPF